MTKEQFNDIKERLDKWIEKRHLTKEGQRAGYFGNIYEELSEYHRANNEYEIIDAICDIAIFTLNSFDYKYNEKYVEIQQLKIQKNIEDITIKDIHRSVERCYTDCTTSRLIEYLECLAFNYGYNFYKCMLEAIKEISSRTGKYDENIGKFIKDKGAYTKEEAKKIYPKCNIEDIGDGFMIFDYKGHTKDYLIKWYKANYESCKL